MSSHVANDELVLLWSGGGGFFRISDFSGISGKTVPQALIPQRRIGGCIVTPHGVAFGVAEVALWVKREHGTDYHYTDPVDSLRMLDFSSGKRVTELWRSPGPPAHSVYSRGSKKFCRVPSPDRDVFLCGHCGGFPALWDATNGTLLGKCDTHSTQYGPLAFNSETRRVYWSGNGHVSSWDLESNQQEALPFRGEARPSHVTSVAWDSSTNCLWTTRPQIGGAPGYPSVVMAFSPNDANLTLHEFPSSVWPKHCFVDPFSDDHALQVFVMSQNSPQLRIYDTRRFDVAHPVNSLGFDRFRYRSSGYYLDEIAVVAERQYVLVNGTSVVRKYSTEKVLLAVDFGGERKITGVGSSYGIGIALAVQGRVEQEAEGDEGDARVADEAEGEDEAQVAEEAGEDEGDARDCGEGERDGDA